MASASPTADRIGREHRDRSGETFERVTGGTKTPADMPSRNRETGGESGRRQRGSRHRRATAHAHAP